jgi:hypothetical protein
MSDQKKPEQKPEQLQGQSLQDVVKMFAENMIPAAVAAAVSAVSTQQAQGSRAPAPQAVRPAPRCPECGQPVTACSNKHISMVVYPTRYPQHAEYFPGAIINGVKYLSNNDSHSVTVPEVSYSDIKTIVSQFEQNEQEMAVGRIAERLSGTVSPRGTQTIQQTQAWR